MGGIPVLVVNHGVKSSLVIFLKLQWLTGGHEAIPYTNSEVNPQPNNNDLLVWYIAM